jgi:hypothetical protein
MSSTTTEIIQVCEALPPDKQAELADFARFLLAQQDDEAWEKRLDNPQARPRLDAFLKSARAEGDEPLQFYDLDHLAGTWREDAGFDRAIAAQD